MSTHACAENDWSAARVRRLLHRHRSCESYLLGTHVRTAKLGNPLQVLALGLMTELLIGIIFHHSARSRPYQLSQMSIMA